MRLPKKIVKTVSECINKILPNLKTIHGVLVKLKLVIKFGFIENDWYRNSQTKVLVKMGHLQKIYLVQISYLHRVKTINHQSYIKDCLKHLICTLYRSKD